MFKYAVRSATFDDFKSIYKLVTDELHLVMALASMKSAYDKIMSRSDETVILVNHSNHIAGFIHVRLEYDLFNSNVARVGSYGYYGYYRDKNILDYLFGAAEKWSVQMDAERLRIVLNQGMLRDKDFLIQNQYINDSDALLLERAL